MLTSTQIRQQFLDFFREKKHTIVQSGSLMPDSPNLLFTNAGMNQFVPIFLGERAADVSKWAGAVPSSDTRAADTQKCIRAGGKHNDLDDVGLDTYHHTFFEMLGNWSFGDYFKKEAIAWAWELIVERFNFPPGRVYATIYQPDPGDPSERDQEAWELWAEKFRSVGLDPAIHIVNGNKKDNFWMMGETGPCGPCSEIHIDLTPAGDTKGRLVNQSSAECIEIWNNVFIQFNANPDGTFTPLPAQHVDTGMGFERLTSIIQGTKNFTDFANAKISNYETDIFRPIFDELEKMSGHRYASTLPQPNAHGQIIPESEQEKVDVAMRVIADHIRTLSFAIADGIQPGNNDRNYVLRRILRRAVRYGRSLGFKEPFFFKLVDVLARTMGDVFPEIRTKQKLVEATLKREEEAFNKTLDTGIEIFEGAAEAYRTIREFVLSIPAAHQELSLFLRKEGQSVTTSKAQQDRLWNLVFAVIHLPTDFDTDQYAWNGGDGAKSSNKRLHSFRSIVSNWQVFWNTKTSGLYDVINSWANDGFTDDFFMSNYNRMEDGLARVQVEQQHELKAANLFAGDVSFQLYDTYGFPLDLTEVMARERGLVVDVACFNELMGQQRARARAAQKKTVIELSEVETKEPTKFVGYDSLSTPAKVLEVVSLKDRTAVVLDASAAYAEMGGQVGDSGELTHGADVWRIANTQKTGHTWLHFLESGSTGGPPVVSGDSPETSENRPRTNAKDRPSTPGASGGSPDATGQRPVLPDALDAFPIPGTEVILTVDPARRNAIQRHHTVTHLLHWALHEVVSKEATQKGSFVGPDKLTFDFNSAALTPAQVRDIERLVNERIVENSRVAWIEVPYADVRGRADVMQFFGDKYGETVRVVQVGGHIDGNGRPALDGYSMELCAGTHTRATGEIGLFRINSEAAIAAGVRRIEAVAGLTAYDAATADMQRLHALAVNLGTPLPELEKRIEGMLAQHKELEKALKSAQQREAAGRAKDLIANAETINGIPAIIANLGALDADAAVALAEALKGSFPGVVVLGAFGVPPSGGSAGGPAKAGTPSVATSVALIASVGKEHQAKVQAGKIIQTIAPIVGGKGGGKPDFARGGGKDASKLDEALAKAKAML